MPRPTWKGAITFGLVTVPVSLVSATERSEKLSFNLLHKKDLSRIEEKRFCAEEQVEVPWEQIVRGYQVSKGKYIVIDDEDFARAKTAATEVFDVRAFVNPDEIDFLYFETPYYVVPSGKPAVKTYALLRDALQDAGKVGVGTIVLREREHVAALEPAGDALVLTMMRFAHEIRSPKDLALPKAAAGYSDKEMKLARQLIQTLVSRWDPRDFQDTYTDRLRRVIDQKAKGRPIAAPAPTRQAEVIDLTKALERSLKEGRRSPARAGARAAAPRLARRRKKKAA